jgi:hypothetical protein
MRRFAHAGLVVFAVFPMVVDYCRRRRFPPGVGVAAASDLSGCLIGAVNPDPNGPN